jgi:DNA polymerase III subunit beta
VQFTVQGKILTDALTFVSAAVPTRSLAPVTSHVRVELAGSSTLTLQATDFDIARKVILDPAASGTDGVAIVPAKPLAKLLARLPGDSDVKIEADTEKLTVRAGRGRWSLPLLDDAFPVLDPPGPGAAKFQLDQTEALRVTRRVTHSISDEEQRFYLNGVCLRQKSTGLVAASTDSRRLTETSIATELDGKLPEVIIPRVAIESLHDVATYGNAVVDVVVDDRKIAFACGPWHATSKLIDGTFPNYAMLLPKPSDNQITVDCEEITHAIARLQVIATEDPAIVGLRWSDENLEILLARQEGAGEEIHATAGGHGRVAVQSKYLLAAIHALDSETVTIDQGADDGPPLLTSTETGTLMLVMPIVWAKESTKQTDTSSAPKLRTARGK